MFSKIPLSRRWKYSPFLVAIDLAIFPAVFFHRRKPIGRGYLNVVCFPLFNIAPAVADGKSSTGFFFLLDGMRCTRIVALCALPVNRPFPSSPFSVFHSESRKEISVMVILFSLWIKTSIHNKHFALVLALKERLRGTRSWLISLSISFCRGTHLA